MFEKVRPLLWGGSEAVAVYECRQCGHTLDADADRCPYCGPTDVVRFEIE